MTDQQNTNLPISVAAKSTKYRPEKTLDLNGRPGDGIIVYVLTSLLTAGFFICIASRDHARVAFSLHNVSDTGALLPLAFFFCFLLGLWAAWSAKESRPVPVDWTDTEIILGRARDTLVTMPWATITSISQQTDWDLINGTQPAFLIRGGLEFGLKVKLKQSDILLQRDLETFFSAVRAHAPDARLELNAQAAHTESYTELWLKYFSTKAPRACSTLLQTKMRLGNDQYEIIGTLGGGGQGTAYLSIYHPKPTDCREKETAKTSEPIIFQNKSQLHDHDQVVLKEYVLPVHRGQAIADRTVEKLKSEVEILSRLDHPQIVKLKDAFIEDHRGYLVLEYVFGESLKALVEREGAQPDKIVAQWMLDVCGIARYMHELTPPVVHRDMTPDNLMLEPSGRIKIVDFNVAHQVDSSATATVVGKHAYIPPEQFRGKPTPQSDIYALGGTMHFLLTSQEPVPISVSHPRSLDQRVSVRLDTIVAKATAYKLEDRYASVAEMEIDLRDL